MNNQTAQGLASLGRNGDTMLVHMSPKEVQGLQGLAMAQGGSLTINPDTGLPEAFSLGGVFNAALPMIGGAVLSPFMGPLAAGLLVGGATALAKGDLQSGLMAGLGAYGGAGLGKTFTAMGAKGGIPVGGGVEAVKQGIAESLPAGGTGNLGMFTNPQATSVMGGVGNVSQFGQAGQYAQSVSDLASAAPAPNFSPISGAVQGTGGFSQANELAKSLGGTGGTYEQLTGGVKQLASDPFGEGFEAFKQAGGTAMDLAMPVGGAVLGGLEPSDLGYGDRPLYNDPDKGKYRGPQGQLNLSDQYDTGLRLVAKGGYIDGYATGGTVSPGGIRDIYGSPDTQPTITPGSQSYGLGRLNQLGNQQSLAQAQTLGYADGGDVGMNIEKQDALNVETLPTLNVETGKSQYNPLNYMTPDKSGVYAGRLFKDFYAQNPDSAMLRLFSRIPNDMVFNKTMAKGGYLNGDGDGMSDSIPATIEGKQPARLADGEFVVPADVVSHLGNGSSKAGSKRLYAMLDKVRQARTGNKKQGKEIKAEKYLPA